MNSISTPPEFDGFDLVAKPVRKWLKAYNRWIVVNNIPVRRKREIMETVLESPTFEEYKEVMADGLRLGGEMIDIPDDVDLQEAAYRDNWNTIETWFINTFDGQEQQHS